MAQQMTTGNVAGPGPGAGVEGPSGPLRVAIWVFAFIFAASLAGIVYITTSGRSGVLGGAGAGPGTSGSIAGSTPVSPIDGDPLAAAPGLEDARFPELALVDQDGRAFTRDEFNGRITVAAFFFTHCPLACPRMTAEMAKAAERLKGTPVKLVSFSLDPVHDRPEVLRAWAARFKADTGGAGKGTGKNDGQWRFVTEPDGVTSEPAGGVIARMLRETWNLEVAPVAGAGGAIKTADGKTTVNLVHPTELYLIGPTGRVLGRYPTSPNAPAGQIEALVKHALAAQAEITAQGRWRGRE